MQERCSDCRDGLSCPDDWQAWYARADEVEAEHGRHSEEWSALLDERPSCPEEADCVTCGGSGLRSRRSAA